MTQKYKVSNSQPPSSLSLIAMSIIGINSLMMSTTANAEITVLDEIVVTGEKIDKSIKDTTTAVTVFSEEDFESGETKQAKDLATKAPNVVTDSFGHISVRGVSGGGAATGGVALMTGARARVSTVVDGTSQDWSGYNFAPTDLWDTKQVEVLRGPQSTTQGASAIGGSIVINTNDPTFEDEAAIRLGLENYDNGNFKHNMAIMSSGAIVEDEIAYRIAADVTKGDGWVNYDTSDYSGELPDLEYSKNQNLRGKLLWKPADNPKLSAKLTVNHAKNEGEHANFVSNDVDGGIETRTLTVADSSGAVARYQDSTEQSFAADINYDIKPGLTNVLHISQIDSDIYADGYGYANGGTTHTYDIEQTTNAIENRLLFNKPNAKLTGVLGVFASDKDSVIDATQGVINIDTDYTTVTTAVYGESTYAINTKTKVTTGLRIENEDTDKTGSFFTDTEADQNTDKTYTLPKLAVTHDITDKTTLGASVRQGYSPSGTYINTSGEVFSFDSEEVTTFEFSVKSDLGDGSTISASVFYNDYTDYQALSGFTIVNVDEATSYGLEVEANTWANEDLELWGSIGLLNSEIDKYDANTDSEGNDLSSTPESNVSFGFTQYLGDSWALGADITYVGEYYSDLDNSEEDSVGGYRVTNAQAQYTQGNLTINGYIKNLTNEDAVYYRDGALAGVGQSRTVGLSALYRM